MGVLATLYLRVRSRIAGGQGVGALLFADADPGQDFWDSVEFSEYETWYIKAGLFKEVLVFADCCRERRPHAPSLKPRLGTPRQNYGTGAMVVVGYGADYGERSYEPAADELDARRGHFTQALMNGLKGGAADPETGAISAIALADYVTDAVKAVTHGTRFPQTPDVRGSLQMEIRPPGLGCLPRIERQILLQFPAGYSGRVELVREREAIAEWDAGRGSWRLPLPEDLSYCVRPLDGQPTFKNGGAFQVIAKDSDVQLEL